MPQNENSDPKLADSKTISRRDFAKGSMAVVGAYSSFAQEAPSPLSDSAKAMKLEIADDVQKLLDDRHITEEDIKRVIEHAESAGLKLYQAGSKTFLSKLRIYQALFYVEYTTLDKDKYRIHTAYLHRFKLGEE
jgi:hypothetical protein